MSRRGITHPEAVCPKIYSSPQWKTRRPTHAQNAPAERGTHAPRSRQTERVLSLNQKLPCTVKRNAVHDNLAAVVHAVHHIPMDRAFVNAAGFLIAAP